MALLVCFTPLTTISLLRSSSLSVSAAPTPISKVGLNVQPKSFGVVTKKKRSSTSTSCVVASSETGGDGDGDGEPLSVNAVEHLPLESEAKEKVLMENKARMRLARKLRLRRKRLVRKRKLRKKGSWPPSKMNKLKNV